MFNRGTVIKYVGNSRARALAMEKGMENWHPDNFKWDFGVVEETYNIGNCKFYRCRIVLLDDVMEHNIQGTYYICKHYRLDLYDFEVEDV